MQPRIETLIEGISRLSAPDEILRSLNGLDPTMGEHSFVEFLAGRAYLEKGQYAKALARLKRSLELDADFGWGHFELGRAFHATGDSAHAVRSVRRFLQLRPDGVSAAHFAICEQICDTAVTKGLGNEAFPLYELITRAGGTRSLTRLRALESALHAGDLARAAELKTELGAPHDAWGHLAFGWYSALAKDFEAAEKHLTVAQELMPSNVHGALRTVYLLRLLVPARATVLLAKFVRHWEEHFRVEDLEFLKLSAGRAVLELGEVEVSLPRAMASSHVTKWPVIDYLYMKSGSLIDENGHEFLRHIRDRFEGDADVVLCLINVEIVNRHYEQARELCRAAIEATGDPDGKLAFKRFEIECFDNNLAAAEALLEEFSLETLDDQQLLMVARMRAEQGRWDKAADILVGLVAGAAEYTGELVDLTVRTARKTQDQIRFVNALRKKPDMAAAGGLLASLLEDLAVQQAGAEACTRILKDAGLERSPMLGFKLSVADPRLGTPAAAHGRDRRAVFYCADRGYVLPAIVSLVSLLEANPTMHAADFFLVLDDGVAREAAAIAGRISDHFETRIEITKSSDISANLSRLNARYGIFTGGHQLATSAYYRIYMARLLAERKRYGELLYIDSDTLVRDGFESIFDIESSDETLLMARLEIDRPEIRKATLQHGLKPGTYFNSGILYFTRVDSELIGRLKEAERIAETEPKRLLFQDQCALNLAFKGAHEALPDGYNFFVPPAKAGGFGKLPYETAKLIHTLDRPKPWDSLYPPRTSVQHMWLNSVRSVRRILGDRYTRPLFDWTFR